MTMQRRDNQGTEFTNWVRTPEELGSNKGYIATDIDLVWENYKKKLFMLLEEKSHLLEPSFCQWKQFRRRHIINLPKEEYMGFHIIQFENLGPEDGRIFLDRKEISKERLISFLKFEDIDRNSFYKIRTRQTPSQIIQEELINKQDDVFDHLDTDLFSDFELEV